VWDIGKSRCKENVYEDRTHVSLELRVCSLSQRFFPLTSKTFSDFLISMETNHSFYYCYHFYSGQRNSEYSQPECVH